MLVGAIVLDDFGTLGWAPRLAVGREWRWAGLVTIIVSGPILFLANTDRYLSNPAFGIKMILLAAAIVLHFMKRETRLGAIFSLLLWTLAVLASRAVIDFDV
jgi:hypothetical protein